MDMRRWIEGPIVMPHRAERGPGGGAWTASWNRTAHCRTRRHGLSQRCPRATRRDCLSQSPSCLEEDVDERRVDHGAPGR